MTERKIITVSGQQAEEIMNKTEHYLAPAFFLTYYGKSHTSRGAATGDISSPTRLLWLSIIIIIIVIRKLAESAENFKQTLGIADAGRLVVGDIRSFFVTTPKQGAEISRVGSASRLNIS